MESMTTKKVAVGEMLSENGHSPSEVTSMLIKNLFPYLDKLLKLTKLLCEKLLKHKNVSSFSLSHYTFIYHFLKPSTKAGSHRNHKCTEKL